MNRKFNSFKILTIVLSLLLLCSCTNSTAKTATASQKAASSLSSQAIKITDDMVTYDEDDYYSEWKNQNPNYIKLNGTSAGLTGAGAEIGGSKITITATGVYVISGKLDNGQIIVDVKDKGIVRLVLNSMEINCADNSPIYVKNAQKTIISLQAGTQNTVTDGTSYAKDEESDSAIFSKDNLTINGTGTLIVNANYNNGIASKDDLKITGGNINITSKDDGLVGRDAVLVKEGSITVKAGGDGIKSTNDTDSKKGFVSIEGGTFNLTTGTDGLQAKTSMLITGGNFNISTGGGSVNGSTKNNDDMRGPWGKWDNNAAAESSETETQSAKGLKAASDITISGGTFKIDSSDDSIHSNNSISISGGDISIASGDDGIHADASIEIKDGKINITKSYEGIESMVITVSGGEIHVTASDDGINVNGGKDGSSTNGRRGQNKFAVSENSKLNINGGYISVDSSGDGLDSNGSVYITDGKIVISGPTDSGNGALDYNGEFIMSGGFLIAAGSAGMAESPSEQSTQSSVNMFFTSTQKAGTLVHLKDGKGNTVATFAPKKAYQSVVICSPLLKKNETYTLYTGGTATGSVSDGLYTDGSYQGGTKVVDFTITDQVTYLTESGVTTAGNVNKGGPGGGFGGGPGRGPRGGPGGSPGGGPAGDPGGDPGGGPGGDPRRGMR
jgi:hypothetical protein